jgi:chemotaxis protein histidine kinase CheA
MATPRFELTDIEAAFEKVANTAGITLSEGDLAHYANRVETYIYVYPAKDDLVEAFKSAATGSPPLKGDVDAMAAEFPVQLTSARNARLKAAKDKADQEKAKAEAENAKQEAKNTIRATAQMVSARLDDVNAIINDLKPKVPAIKGAAVTAEVTDVDDVVEHLQAIEDAATGLLKCQTDLAKTSSLKTAQAVEKRSLQHLADANAAKIAIEGIETRVNSRVEAAKTTKAKEKESAKKAKKEKVGKLDRFRSSWTGHAVIIAIFVIVMTTLFFGFLPFWFQVGAIIVFVSVLGYHAAMWFTGHERRGQNVTAIVTVFATMAIAVLLLMSLAGTGRGSDGSLLPNRQTETSAPADEQQPDCWLAENAGRPECPLGTTPES